MSAEVVSAVADSVTALAAAFAAGFAYAALSSWRQQLRGNVEFDAARRCLTAAYKVRDAVQYVRNPFHSAEEIAATGIPAGEDYERALYSRRLEQMVVAVEDLRLSELEGQVLWGADFSHSIKGLTRCTGSLQWAVADYFRRKHNPDSPSFAQAAAVVKSTGDPREPDEFEKRLMSAVEELESFLRPRLDVLGRGAAIASRSKRLVDGARAFAERLRKRRRRGVRSHGQ